MPVQPDPDETALTYLMALATTIESFDQSMQGQFKDDFIRLLDRYVEGAIVGAETEGQDIRTEVEAAHQVLKQCLEIAKLETAMKRDPGRKDKEWTMDEDTLRNVAGLEGLVQGQRIILAMLIHSVRTDIPFDHIRQEIDREYQVIADGILTVFPSQRSFFLLGMRASWDSTMGMADGVAEIMAARGY